MKNNSEIKFSEFPKMARLSRECIITEKIDGTNAQVFITEDPDFNDPMLLVIMMLNDKPVGIYAGSRNRWITRENDNFGFATWVAENAKEIVKLGVGRHFGEWWGSGIQRGYGLEKGEKRFSLFNVQRWCLHNEQPQRIETSDPRIEKYQDVLPSCCGLVPILSRGNFHSITFMVDRVMNKLQSEGSVASPGFMNPEGVVIFHLAGNVGFKKTIEKDHLPKSIA